MTAIIPTGESIRIHFDTWDAESYALFLRTKALPEHTLLYDEDADTYTIETPTRFARVLGLEVPPVDLGNLPLAAHLFDYQAFFCRVALEAKRYACWFDTGLGKTAIEWEWARQVQHRTGGKVLGIYLLNLIPDALKMARAWYGDAFADAIVFLETREQLIAWCKDGQPGIAVTNPEKFIPRDEQEVIPEITYLAGIFIDESSLLKTGGGAIKWALIKSCRGVEFKLSCTATPAPNDPIEYASQASWLEKIRDEGEVIWTYFVRDKEGEWKVKAHALADFYRFLSGWSCYLRSPKRYGFADNLKDLPPPERIVYRVPATPEQLDYAARIPSLTGQRSVMDHQSLGLVERMKLGQVSSGFAYRPDGGVDRIPSLKPSRIAAIVRQDVAQRLQVIVWTQYDETAEILSNLLGLAVAGDPRMRVAVLTGKTPREDRQGLIDRFRAGEIDVLITRPKLLAFGQNLQNAGSQVFADFSDSYEQLYQGERRSYRYGQTRMVRLHYPVVEELQGVVWANVEQKRERFESDVEVMERLYIEAMRAQLPAER